MLIRNMSLFKFILSFIKEIWHTRCIIFSPFLSLYSIKFWLNVLDMLLELSKRYFLIPLVMFRRKPYVQEMVLFPGLIGTCRNDLLMRHLGKIMSIWCSIFLWTTVGCEGIVSLHTTFGIVNFKCCFFSIQSFYDPFLFKFSMIFKKFHVQAQL